MTGARKTKEKLSRQDIGFLFKTGKFFKRGKLALRWDCKGKGAPLFCVTTFKKNIRPANQRNRMRRLSREFFRKNQKQMKQGLRLILQIGGYSDQKFSEFEKSTKKIFEEAGLISDE